MNDSTEARVVLSLDLDAFYASALLQLPEHAHLSSLPVGIVQKYLVVTSNYIARARGVQKMCSVSSALQICPEMSLLDGSDLTPFRAAAHRIRRCVSKRFPSGTPIEYLGLDEVFVDITAVVSDTIRSRDAKFPWTFSGHVIGNELRDSESQETCGIDDRAVRAMQLGSQVAANLRASVRELTGFSMSAGISNSKLGAKLAASMHKPNDQTVVLSSYAVRKYLEAKSPISIPGFGRGYMSRLEAWADPEAAKHGFTRRKISTVQDLLATFAGQDRELARALDVSERYATCILRMCRGFDNDPVKRSSAPISISSEDSMKACCELSDVRRRVLEISRKLVMRIVDDIAEHGIRYPSALTVKYRFSNSGWRSTIRAAPMPTGVYGLATFGHENEGSLDSAAQLLAKAATALLLREGNLLNQRSFCLTLIGVGVSRFSADRKRRSDMIERGVQSLLDSPGPRVIHREANPTLNVSKKLPCAARQQGLHTESTPLEIEHDGLCPICGQTLFRGMSNISLNRHIDGCLESVPRERKRARAVTSQNTFRVDSFFKPD
jgi:DNA polymerase iota